MGARGPTWSRGPAKVAAAGAAVLAIGAVMLVALLADAPVDHGRKAVERLSSSWASCGELGAAPCDAASVGHLRQVRAGSVPLHPLACRETSRDTGSVQPAPGPPTPRFSAASGVVSMLTRGMSAGACSLAQASMLTTPPPLARW